MAALGTAAVDCPRCDDTITVTLEAGTPEPPKPGAKSVNVPLHNYEAAGHTA